MKKPSECQGDHQYLAILEELKALHVRKAMDYGSDEDPLANLRGSDDIGIVPWMGVWLRTLDKVRRMNRYCRKGQLANEGVEDTLLDMAAYACLALRLFRETLPVVTSESHSNNGNVTVRTPVTSDGLADTQEMRFSPFKQAPSVATTPS